MKILRYTFQFFFLLISFALITSCEDTCEVTQTYYYFEPVYEDIEKVRSSGKIGSTQTY